MAKEHAIAVNTPEVGGVRIQRHPLDGRTRDIASIARLFSRRVHRWEKNHDLDGDEEIAMPPLEVLKMAEIADRVTRGLLHEQRMRAAMGSGKPTLTDDEYREELAALEERAVLEMPEPELVRLLELRAAAR